MNKGLYRFSLLLNVIFILCFLVISIKYKEQIQQKWIDQKGKAEIVMFGDSHIKSGNWSTLLNQRDVKNSGYTGFTTLYLKSGIKKKVINFQPKICIIEAGINDLMIGVPLQSTKSNFQIIVETLIANNITPVVTSVFYTENNNVINLKVDSLNIFLENYCKQKNIKFLDINVKFSEKNKLSPKFSEDGIHLTKEAYFVWAEEINSIIK